MSLTNIILLERVPNLGQMGELVSVKPGYARNYLLPCKKALRATAANRERFEKERAQLEARNIEKRQEAEKLAEKMKDLSVVLIRQAGDSGNLYGSVTARDIAQAVSNAGLSVNRNQIVLAHPIKTLGIFQAKIVLHPEVSIDASINVARSEDEAERQARGESVIEDGKEQSKDLLDELYAEQAEEETSKEDADVIAEEEIIETKE